MKRSRQSTSLNAGTMADVAFLLLIFFMVVTTFQREKSLSMRLPPKVDSPPQKVLDKKVLSILINGDNDIMIEHEIATSNLDDLVHQHLINMIDQKISPIINLSMHPQADYQSYLSTLSEIKSGIRLAKDALAQEIFSSPLEKLSRSEYATLNNQCKIRITESVVTL